jgi:hypothetical protein
MLEQVQNEIDMVKRNPEEYRSAFYIMQKNERRWVMWTKAGIMRLIPRPNGIQRICCPID